MKLAQRQMMLTLGWLLYDVAQMQAAEDKEDKKQITIRMASRMDFMHECCYHSSNDE